MTEQPQNEQLAEKLAEEAPLTGDHSEESSSEPVVEVAPAPRKKNSFWTFANICALLFVVALLVFNFMIFFGAEKDHNIVQRQPSDHHAQPRADVYPVDEGPKDGSSKRDYDPNITTDKQGHSLAPAQAPRPGQAQAGTVKPPPKKGAAVKPGDAKTMPAPPPGQTNKLPRNGEKVVAPPPPPDPAKDRPRQDMPGTQLLLGLAVFNNNPDKELRLTAEQKTRLQPILQKLRVPVTDFVVITEQALGLLTKPQVQWMMKNRGEAQVKSGKVERGMDPTTSAAMALFRTKGAKATGTQPSVKHASGDLQFHDIMNGVIKLEQEAPQLAITPNQAKALQPLLEKVNQSRKAEIDLYVSVYTVLHKKQIAWLRANTDKVQPDLHSLILQYVDLLLQQDNAAPIQKKGSRLTEAK